MTNDSRSPEEIERELERDRTALRDTLGELQEELSLTGLSRRATRQLQEHGSEWAQAASAAARANPVALALTGVGVAWMVFGRGYDPTHIRRSDGARDPAEAPRYRGPVAIPRGNATAYAAPRHPEFSPRPQSAERETTMTDSIKSSARHLRDQLHEGTEDLGEEARRRVREARYRAIRVRDRASRGLTRGQRRMSDGYDSEPLAFGVAAFLLGAGLAALLPRTRREEEMLGQYGEQLYHEAEAILAEEKAKLSRAVSAGLDEAKTAVSDISDVARSELDAQPRRRPDPQLATPPRP